MTRQEMVKFAIATWPNEAEIENCGKGKSKSKLADWIRIKISVQRGYAILSGDTGEAERLSRVGDVWCELYT